MKRRSDLGSDWRESCRNDYISGRPNCFKIFEPYSIAATGFQMGSIGLQSLCMSELPCAPLCIVVPLSLRRRVEN
jgi:hypothetical protein